MKSVQILLLLPIFFLSLSGAVVDKEDGTSIVLKNGCNQLQFNKNPETFSYGIVLGFVKGTYDEYNAHIQLSGAEYKEKRIAHNPAQMTQSACKTAFSDKSEDRFADVLSAEVRKFVRSNYKDADEYKDEKRRTKKTKEPSGIDAFLQDDSY